MSKLPRTVFRQLDGILLLDKPPGMSSNQALQRVRHLFRAEKAGHTGSLDPLATGLLPVCFGEATKLAGHLLGNAKSYEVVARLGVTTDTDDADGQVLRERPVPELDEERISAALQGFIGRIRQRPPIYSALKQGGEPLYAKARRGESIEVPEREVEVRSIELLEFSRAELRLRITCGSGTYIRSIVRDLGELLGCGAHVTALRRLWVEPFTEPAMHTLDELRQLSETQGEAALDAVLLPIAAAMVLWPRVGLDSLQALALGRGQTVQLGQGQNLAGEVNAVDATGRSLGLAEVDGNGVLRAKRLFRWAAQGG
ncbi:MAG: tRNA pseudouridine(55) synthase TruB [Arenimonas sp.]|jgi:tRNA pseudouridine55 synthase